MSQTLKQLSYICAVRDQGSFAKAAQSMNISQSSVLAAVDAAEQDFGFQIFSRQKGRGVIVTPAGERFIAAARRLLGAESDFHHEVRAQGFAGGQLRIGLYQPFGSILIVEVLTRLRDALGDISIELFEADQPSLKRLLDQGEVDIILVYDLGPDFNGTVEQIGRSSPHAVVPADHPLAQKQSVSINELVEHPVMLLSMPLTVTYNMMMFDFASKRPNFTFKSHNYETIIRAVSAGFGVAILNLWPRQPLAVEAGTRRIPIKEKLPKANIVTVDHYGELRPKPVEMFIDVLKHFFQEAYDS